LFELDVRIQSTCFFLGQWRLSTVLLKNDERYPWFLLVPRVMSVQEIHQLSKEEQYILIQEINQLSLFLKNYYQPKKINVASLGNIVTQLHIHCLARLESDPLWPHGVWQPAYQAKPYSGAWIEHKLPSLKQAIMEMEQST
jgi:diadenosine tetraphosphate (Ap4A) HIT family hydrolase